MSLTKVTYSQINGAPVNVLDFGAVGDGVADDRAAIQAAFDYAVSLTTPITVLFPNGIYYLGTGYSDAGLGVQLVLGSKSAINTNTNISISGNSATIYQGAAGKALGVFGANGVDISGFKFIGYTGGTLGATRENDALITVNYTSSHVTIHDNYFTNGLGDCIYLGGTLVSGGGTGAQCTDISIFNNTLKTRYGNGVSSFTGGTMSRTAIAIIDAVNVDIKNNRIYGKIDLEPNLDGQHIVNVSIANNSFLSGHVTAQSVVGTSYWYDEPLNASGGSSLEQTVSIVGAPSAAIVTGNVLKNNTFENGLVITGLNWIFQSIEGNSFIAGQIRVGYTSGPNNTSYTNVVNNTTYGFYTGQSTFIRLDGNCTYCLFDGNTAVITAINTGYCINNNGASTGDAGRCVFTNNKITGNTQLGVIRLTASTTSFVGNNLCESGVSSVQMVVSGASSFISYLSPMITIATTGTNQVLNWPTYPGNFWYMSDNTGNDSISQITNVPAEGFRLTIMTGKTGGRTLTINYNSSYFRTKGSVNAVMSDPQHMITFVARAGIFFEESRSF